MNPLCRCSHPLADHEVGIGKERCLPEFHRACGCDEYRLDPRSLVCGEDEAAENVA